MKKGKDVKWALLDQEALVSLSILICVLSFIFGLALDINLGGGWMTRMGAVTVACSFVILAIAKNESDTIRKKVETDFSAIEKRKESLRPHILSEERYKDGRFVNLHSPVDDSDDGWRKVDEFLEEARASSRRFWDSVWLFDASKRLLKVELTIIAFGTMQSGFGDLISDLLKPYLA